jgi:hypothetical protein
VQVYGPVVESTDDSVHDSPYTLLGAPIHVHRVDRAAGEVYEKDRDRSDPQEFEREHRRENGDELRARCGREGIYGEHAAHESEVRDEAWEVNEEGREGDDGGSKICGCAERIVEDLELSAHQYIERPDSDDRT